MPSAHDDISPLANRLINDAPLDYEISTQRTAASSILRKATRIRTEKAVNLTLILLKCFSYHSYIDRNNRVKYYHTRQFI